MFVGHYGVSYALKKADPEARLSHLFLGVQLADVAWSSLVLLGIEKVRIIPGFLAASPLDLYYMPFTHSLEAALAWSLLTYLACWCFSRRPAVQKRKTALVMAFSVFSHWLLDVPVHGHDLGLWGNSLKIGFGLWHYPVASFVLEGLCQVLGLVLYLRSTRATSNVGRFGMGVFGSYLLALNAVNIFWLQFAMPDGLYAAGALVSYLLFAAIAAWLERGRVPVAAAPSAPVVAAAAG